jgi:hypothetical protein
MSLPRRLRRKPEKDDPLFPGLANLMPQGHVVVRKKRRRWTNNWDPRHFRYVPNWTGTIGGMSRDAAWEKRFGQELPRIIDEQWVPIDFTKKPSG